MPHEVIPMAAKEKCLQFDHDFVSPTRVQTDMSFPATIPSATQSTAMAAADLFAGSGSGSRKLVHLALSFGLVGLFLVSTVDSSFVPLPIPGMTDIMIILFAAQHTNAVLLVAVATAGSALGGLLSHQAGHAGGLGFIEKRMPPAIFKRVCAWMENHAILAVALPAILPPPMPLSPFVLAAGALKMSRKKFMTTFTISRCVRHSVAAWLGIRYGHEVIRFWNHFSTHWGTAILTVLWVGIGLSLAFAFRQIWKTTHTVGIKPGRKPPVKPVEEVAAQTAA